MPKYLVLVGRRPFTASASFNFPKKWTASASPSLVMVSSRFFSPESSFCSSSVSSWVQPPYFPVWHLSPILNFFILILFFVFISGGWRRSGWGSLIIVVWMVVIIWWMLGSLIWNIPVTCVFISTVPEVVFIRRWVECPDLCTLFFLSFWSSLFCSFV